MGEFYEDVKKILEGNRESILENPAREAIEGIKRTVDELVRVANLPSAISENYKRFAEDERLLFTSDSYRDHFFHPFHTFLLGYIILNKVTKSGSSHKSPFPTTDDFLKQWLVTALWHDITYVAEKGPEWLEAFIRKRLNIQIKAAQDWGPIVSDIGNLDAIKKICRCFEQNDSERCLAFESWAIKQLTDKYHDHGILSSVLLMREQGKEGNECEPFIVECSLAIALHNYQQAYYEYHSRTMVGESGCRGGAQEIRDPLAILGKLSITQYPLAFLLAFCDTAQEWGRPSSIRNHTEYLKYAGVEVKDEQKLEVFVHLAYEENHSDQNEKLKIEKLKTTWELPQAFNYHLATKMVNIH